MLKGSGLLRAYPRLNARTRRATGAESIQVLQPTPTILRLLWRSAGVLCIAFGGIIVGVLIVLHVAVLEVATDVLTPYGVIYPGLALTDLDSSDCSAYTISLYTHEEQCELRLLYPDGDHLCNVTLAIHDSRIGKVRFQCSDLYVGDLVRQWGRPDEITRSVGGYLLRWSQKGMVAQARGSQWFNYQLPVETVLLT
jgi:hypothetical protein